MRFNSQRVAYWFFATCMLLLSLQIVYGFIMALAHIGHDVLHALIPFNVARASHTNLLVVWLLAGFMGAAYFIVPEECDRELYWPGLAWVQLVSLVVVGVIAIVGFHVGWWEGRKFLEIPRPLDYLVVVERAAVHRQHRHDHLDRAPHHDHRPGAVLRPPGGGAALSAGHDRHADTRPTTRYWRWWVVHLWVEGVWELIMGGILAFLLIKLTGRRPRGRREVALRDRRPHLPLGHPRHRPPLLLHRHAVVLALDRRHLQRPRAARLPRHGDLRRRHGAEGRASAPEPHRADLDGRLRGDVVRRRRLPRHRPHDAAGEPLHARHAHHRDARTHGVLGRLRDDRAGDHLLRDAAADGSQALRGRGLLLCVLGVEHRDGRDDRRLRRRRRRPGLPRAAHGHGLRRRAARDRGALLGRHPRGAACFTSGIVAFIWTFIRYGLPVGDLERGPVGDAPDLARARPAMA